MIALSAILGFAAGIAVMAVLYGDRAHGDFMARMDSLRAWANGEPQTPANDHADAPTRAREAGL